MTCTETQMKNFLAGTRFFEAIHPNNSISIKFIITGRLTIYNCITTVVLILHASTPSESSITAKKQQHFDGAKNDDSFSPRVFSSPIKGV